MCQLPKLRMEGACRPVCHRPRHLAPSPSPGPVPSLQSHISPATPSLLFGIPLRCLNNSQRLRIAPPQMLMRGPQPRVRQESKPQPARSSPEARGATAGPDPPGRAEHHASSQGREQHHPRLPASLTGPALFWGHAALVSSTFPRAF